MSGNGLKIVNRNPRSGRKAKAADPETHGKVSSFQTESEVAIDRHRENIASLCPLNSDLGWFW